MSKKVQIIKEKHKDKEIFEKILDLCLLYENENSKNWIELVSYQITSYEIQKQHLIDNKPFFFQKKKLLEYKKKNEEIDFKIVKCLSDIEEEINYMESNINFLCK